MTDKGSREPRRAGDAPGIDDGRPALEEDAAASLADQTASDSDQTASDSDQTASERDEADADSDQAASDADQAIADSWAVADGADGQAAHEAARLQRERNTVQRLMTHRRRAESAQRRARVSEQRDATAAQRDETARRRDPPADIGEGAPPTGAPLMEQLERLRAAAAADRARAAEDRAAAAAERARLEAALHSAHLDDLTGAFRREMGWIALAQEVERARRGDGRFVLAFVDVDRLKDINDRDGHAAGDEALRRVVEALRAHLRSFDPIVRYGGDEFVCGLGGAALAEVQRRFDGIAGSLDEAGLGVSVGLAQLAANETLDDLVARADAALLVVKRKRNASSRD